MDECTHKPFEDGSHIIYVNAAYQGEDRIGRLMHDFRCTDADDMYNPILAEKVRYFKETEGGREQMCKLMEDIAQRTAKETRTEIAASMFGKGYPIEEIADILRIPVNDIRKMICQPKD